MAREPGVASNSKARQAMNFNADRTQHPEPSDMCSLIVIKYINQQVYLIIPYIRGAQSIVVHFGKVILETCLQRKYGYTGKVLSAWFLRDLKVATVAITSDLEEYFHSENTAKFKLCQT